MEANLIGAKEAADILGVNRTGIIRRVASGELKPVQKLPGTRGAYIFNREDVLAHVVPTPAESDESESAGAFSAA